MAHIHAGPGVYTHLAYFHAPEGPHMCGKVQLSHASTEHVMNTVRAIRRPAAILGGLCRSGSMASRAPA